jgi:serine/threonine protein kinase
MDRVEDDLQDDPEDGSKVLVDDQTRERLIQKYRVIHNDIHSDNIIRREDGNYILLDFGLAIQGENVVRSSRRSDGAPEFKAPEKWDGDTDLTTQSDIYGLGVVLYECLAGRVPFPLSSEESGSVKALYLLGESHKSQIPDSIYELRKAAYEKANPGQTYDAPDYPQWLEEVIMKCLEKKPQDRFLNGKELYAYVMEKKAEEKAKAYAPVQEPIVEPIVEPIAEPVPAEPVKVVSSKGLKAWRAAAILSGFLAVAMAAFCFYMQFVSDPADEPAVKEEQKVFQPLDIDHPAVVYLESNVSLSRSDMEDIPELRGLWDAVNTYDFEKYASYFTILQNSNGYMNLLMRLRDKKESLGYLNETGETFVPEGEDEIHLISYMFRLMRY